MKTGDPFESYEIQRLTESAMGGYSFAQYELGKKYEHGIGVPRNRKKALHWHRSAAVQGHEEATIHLATLPKLKTRDPSEICEIDKLMEAAARGDANAQYELAERYEHGKGVRKSIERAENLYRSAANQGHVEAGLYLEKHPDMKTQDPAEKNESERLMQSAMREDAAAEYELASRYQRGRGVRKNYKQADRLYRSAAAKDHVEAGLHLGERFLVFKPKETISLNQRAALEGNVHAQWLLALAYGLCRKDPLNLDEAIKCCRMAADQGDPFAQWHLGKAYEYGRGVTRNRAEATKWYRSAASKARSYGELKDICGECLRKNSIAWAIKDEVGGEAEKCEREAKAEAAKLAYKAGREELLEQLAEALSNILLGEKIPLDVVNAQTGEIIIPANREITRTLLYKMACVYDHVDIDPSPIRNKIREIIGHFEHKFAELELQLERVFADQEPSYHSFDRDRQFFYGNRFYSDHDFYSCHKDWWRRKGESRKF